MIKKYQDEGEKRCPTLKEMQEKVYTFWTMRARLVTILFPVFVYNFLRNESDYHFSFSK